VRVSVARPDFDAEVNVLGTIRVLEAARAEGTRMIFSSSGGAIYGECTRPARESDTLEPIAPYGVSKLAGEEYLAAYSRLYAAAHVSLRYGNVYGPRQNPHGEAGVVAIFFQRLAAGERPTVYGDGSQTRDYVHVDDVVAATLAAESADGGVYNVGMGIETSVLDLLHACARVAGVAADADFAAERLGELQRSVLDPGRAERELGWRRRFELEDGLRHTWEWTTAMTS
jgi:UDP-glucose 4-epimerase